ncbi:RagB/SusD family nutrient uptake outer membrane protein [Butyricimonas sp. BSD2780061689_150309_C8]|uniref:RagB/SusD family nutrient uptake outer membrane protein n=1 Tax=Butyricimonas sp. BSD2780061689_150309_C8 TaxID=2787088 RepID=UPI001E4B15FF|nr:RagB/SusD family nutrient uptake outer membrane protein [Butyricimonas sp. BSD2780061689_150309_C8]
MNQIDEEYIFTVDVAKAYLARTYFWAQDWKNAVATAKELLDKYPLIEGEEYEAMIQSTPPFTTKPGNVILCSYNRGTLSTAFKTRYSTDSRRRPVSLKFAELFKEKEKDIRYKLFFDKTFLNTKRLNMQIRSAEMCLIMAESYAHLQDEDNALLYLNSLRAKRITDYVPLTMSSLPAVDNSALVTVDAEGKALTPLMASILNERRKELYMEGDRWFELKRNGRPEFWVGYNGIKSTTWKYLYTFPLWKQDLRVNPNLVQNEGYE